MENDLEFEPVYMAGDVQRRRYMYGAGKLVEFLKVDWDMAYKHVSVRCEDHPLQAVEFGGNYFVEKCLTFGVGTAP